MSTIKFVVVGGFLGAGKTTLVARLANYYQQQGQRVAVVTNDQAQDLVDTHTLRQQGFTVGEVAGACFCCKFHDLVDVTRQLTNASAPDVVIAEPVGSCTDIQATVIEPLRHLHGDRYVLAPFVVLLKPEHGRKILTDQNSTGISPKAAYIFLKQLEEADVIAINKIDKLSEEMLDELTQAVRHRFASKPVFPISARTGQGCQPLFEHLEQFAWAADADHTLDIDYDVYAAGEAELGWLNAQVNLERELRWPLDQAVIGLVSTLQRRLENAGVEPAHLKVYAESGQDAAVANWVSRDEPPELSVTSEAVVNQAQLVINARVVAAPELLEGLVRESLAELQQQWGVRATVVRLQRFRPARPVPTYRWA
jgi:G3E family GTPase